MGEVLATNTQPPRTFGDIPPQDTSACSLIARGRWRSTCHKHPISMPSQETGRRAPSLCCLIGLGSCQSAWVGGNTPPRLPHPVCSLYVSDLFNLPAITNSGGRWPFKLASGGARTCAKPSDQSQNGISSTETRVWPGGSRFWMGMLTNHLW